MTTISDLLLRQETHPSVSIRVATVTGYGDNGLNLDLMGVPVSDAMLLDSYKPARGDTVAVISFGPQQWLVLGRMGMPKEVVDDSVKVSWGSGAPSGSGWAESGVGGTFVKKGQVYVNTSGSITPPPDNKPKEVIKVDVTATAGYQRGHRYDLGDYPVQGAWPGNSANSGIWLYGTDTIKDACAGRTVDSMKMEISRLNNGSGVYRPISAHLYTHNENRAPYSTPSFANSFTPTKKLDSGDSYRGNDDAVVLPAGAVQDLANGSAQGMGCYAPVSRSQYLMYGNCGRLWITLL